MDRVNDFINIAYLTNIDKYYNYRFLGKNYEDNLAQKFRYSLNALKITNTKFLDLGCGFNHNLGKLKYSEYVGIDLS
jgi:hypothetical protein